MNSQTEATKKDYMNSLGALASIDLAKKSGNCRQEGNNIIYKVGDEERRMSLEEMKKHEKTLAKYIGNAVELVSMTGKLDKKSKSSR